MNPLKLVLDYRLTDQALQIHSVGNVLLAEVPLDEIAAVSYGLPLFALPQWWLNRLDVWETAVTIRRTKGLCRYLVITPERPQQFVATLNRLRQRKTPPAPAGGGG